MRRFLIRCCLIITLLLLCSCHSDVKEIQNLNYATAIGVDFKDNKYHLFIQLINFPSIASTEGKITPASTFISDTVGETFIDAFFKMYESGQERFIWSHITAIVLTESVLKEGLSEVFDGLSRYYEFRFTPWIFVTKDPLEEILVTQGFFDQSSLETVLHEPKSIYEQSSLIRPIKLQQFAREFLEPAHTTFIPSITVFKKTWKKNKKPEPKLAINGAYFIHDQKYKGFFSIEQLSGLPFFVPETMRSPTLVPDREHPDFLIVVDYIKTDIQIKEENNQFRFIIDISGEGNIANEIKDNNRLREMEKMTNERIKNQIEKLFQLGIDNGIDFLNLEHVIYRKKNKEWKKTPHEEFLQKELIADIKVDISILHSGAYKNKRVKIK